MSDVPHIQGTPSPSRWTLEDPRAEAHGRGRGALRQPTAVIELKFESKDLITTRGKDWTVGKNETVLDLMRIVKPVP